MDLGILVCVSLFLFTFSLFLGTCFEVVEERYVGHTGTDFFGVFAWKYGKIWVSC